MESASSTSSPRRVTAELDAIRIENINLKTNLAKLEIKLAHFELGRRDAIDGTQADRLAIASCAMKPRSELIREQAIRIEARLIALRGLALESAIAFDLLDAELNTELKALIDKRRGLAASVKMDSRRSPLVACSN